MSRDSVLSVHTHIAPLSDEQVAHTSVRVNRAPEGRDCLLRFVPLEHLAVHRVCAGDSIEVGSYTMQQCRPILSPIT